MRQVWRERTTDICLLAIKVKNILFTIVNWIGLPSNLNKLFIILMLSKHFFFGGCMAQIQ